ncbi:MAG: 1-acyl-sn-glycerol-3-phosphate acyltransferase [Halanaerobiales bacterium]|nr:1-acyl-sn-glycerol-3-phosphate acyltransferase [Halanaerobiales bacterium]
MNLIYWFSRRLVWIYLKVFKGFTIYGLENIPKEGSLIVVGNHTSFLDPLVLGVAMNRMVRVMAKHELFKKLGIDWFLRQLGAFPVKRGQADLKAMRKSLKILKHGGVLGVFPEGTRNKSGQLGKAQLGIVKIALRTKALILPCGLINISSGKKPFIANIGKPLTLDKYYGLKLTKEEEEKIGKFIMDEIAKLLELDR